MNCYCKRVAATFARMPALCTRQAEAFADDRRGGVMVVFAIAIVPVIFLTGMALDYGRASSAQMKLQAAADAAALATLNAQFTNDADRLTIAQQVFQSNLANDSTLSGVTPTVSPSATSTGTVAARIQTTRVLEAAAV